MASSNALRSHGRWPSRPKIIFADEPTGNLDSVTGTEILSFMRGAVREFGQTIVMVTHDPVAASYADRVIFVGDGKIVGELTDPTVDRDRSITSGTGTDVSAGTPHRSQEHPRPLGPHASPS